MRWGIVAAVVDYRHHERLAFPLYMASLALLALTLVIAPVTRIEWKPVETLPDTARGEGGFGSTGTG